MGTGNHDLLTFWDGLCPVAPDTDDMGLKRNGITCIDPIQEDIPDRLESPDISGLILPPNGC